MPLAYVLFFDSNDRDIEDCREIHSKGGTVAESLKCVDSTQFYFITSLAAYMIAQDDMPCTFTSQYPSGLRIVNIIYLNVIRV